MSSASKALWRSGRSRTTRTTTPSGPVRSTRSGALTRSAHRPAGGSTVRDGIVAAHVQPPSPCAVMLRSTAPPSSACEVTSSQLSASARRARSAMSAPWMPRPRSSGRTAAGDQATDASAAVEAGRAAGRPSTSARRQCMPGSRGDVRGRRQPGRSASGRRSRTPRSSDRCQSDSFVRTDLAGCAGRSRLGASGTLGRAEDRARGPPVEGSAGVGGSTSTSQALDAVLPEVLDDRGRAGWGPCRRPKARVEDEAGEAGAAQAKSVAEVEEAQVGARPRRPPPRSPPRSGPRASRGARAARGCRAFVSGRGGRTAKRFAGRSRYPRSARGRRRASRPGSCRIEIRPDLPSLKLPRIVSHGLAGAEISSSRPPSNASRVPGCQAGQLDALGRQVLADRARHDGVALGGHAPDGLDGRAGRPPDAGRRGRPDAPGRHLQARADRPRRRGRVLRHAAGRDVDLHDPPAAEWRLRPTLDRRSARVASWVSTMPPMLHGAERLRPVGRREAQALGRPCQRMSEIAQLLDAQRRVRTCPVGQRGRRLERVVAGQHGREARLVGNPRRTRGPPSDRRLRTAIAVSSRALPTAAVAQSTRTARSPMKVMLPLKTSLWTSCLPASDTPSSAAMRTGKMGVQPTSGHHAKTKKGSGSSATRTQRCREPGQSSRGGRPSGGVTSAFDLNAARAAPGRPGRAAATRRRQILHDHDSRIHRPAGNARQERAAHDAQDADLIEQGCACIARRPFDEHAKAVRQDRPRLAGPRMSAGMDLPAAWRDAKQPGHGLRHGPRRPTLTPLHAACGLHPEDAEARLPDRARSARRRWPGRAPRASAPGR